MRRRDPREKVGRPQVASACTQAAALIETYRSVRRAYVEYHGKQDIQSAIAEDSAAWLAARFNLMLQEDGALSKDRMLRQSVKWCMESCKQPPHRKRNLPSRRASSLSRAVHNLS